MVYLHIFPWFSYGFPIVFPLNQRPSHVDPQEDMVYPKHLPAVPGVELGTALRVVIAARRVLGNQRNHRKKPWENGKIIGKPRETIGKWENDPFIDDL